MNIFDKFALSWISFHGIIDIFLPLHIWIPIYSIIPYITLYLPQNYINYLIIPLTIHHFSKDFIYIFPFNYFIIVFLLSLGLSYKEYIISQNCLKIYLCLIHTPLNIYLQIQSFYVYYTLFMTFLIIYITEPLLIEIDNLIKNPNNQINMKKKLLIGIILSHTLCNL